LHIGKPIHTADLKTDALNAQVEAWIESEMMLLDQHNQANQHG
jgi:1-acyl-sn-glycerol-3-phosphate acyltransferase